MSETKKPAAAPVVPAAPVAPTTAIAPAKTIDDVMALLKVDERTSEGNPKHEAQDTSASVAWIGYRSNKSKAKLEELLAAKVEENTFYLYDKGVIYPKPFYVHLLAGFHFYSKVDKQNEVVGVSAVLNPALKAEGFSDHFIGLLLVRLPGETPMFKAATFGQRKAMTRAMDDLRAIVGAFEKDKAGREWAARGDKHKAAIAESKWPGFAVRARIWGKLAAHQSGGDDYNLGLSSVEPTPIEDVKALNRYMGLAPESYGGENKKGTEFANAMKVFGRRRAEFVQQIAEEARG